MIVRMLETRRGSNDGFKVIRFEAGFTGFVSRSLAVDFIRRGWAVAV